MLKRNNQQASALVRDQRLDLDLEAVIRNARSQRIVEYSSFKKDSIQTKKVPLKT